ncbi:MAG: sigma factor-like helix-turn-helix DNA-binding protein [Oscillospiraceae bacterium]
MQDNMTILYDIYGELLPKSQREVLDLRYNSDLSIAEIAEELGGISRPAVNNARKKGEDRLLELEGILGSAKRYKEISDLLTQAEEHLEKLSDSDTNVEFVRIREIFEDIRKRL